MALGATRATILRTFLAASTALALTGCAIGATGSLLLRPVLTHWIALSVIGSDPDSHLILTGTSPTIIAAAVLLLTTILASWLPASRAAGVEPMEALRAE